MDMGHCTYMIGQAETSDIQFKTMPLILHKSRKRDAYLLYMELQAYGQNP
jgi:hypothetical protein